MFTIVCFVLFTLQMGFAGLFVCIVCCLFGLLFTCLIALLVFRVVSEFVFAEFVLLVCSLDVVVYGLDSVV